MRQEDFAGEFLEEAGRAEPVADRADYFGQVEFDAGIHQAVIDRDQAFQRAGIDEIDRREHQYEIGDAIILGDDVGDEFLKKARIGKIQRPVDA